MSAHWPAVAKKKPLEGAGSNPPPVCACYHPPPPGRLARALVVKPDLFNR